MNQTLGKSIIFQFDTFRLAKYKPSKLIFTHSIYKVGFHHLSS